MQDQLKYMDFRVQDVRKQDNQGNSYLFVDITNEWTQIQLM